MFNMTADEIYNFGWFVSICLWVVLAAYMLTGKPVKTRGEKMSCSGYGDWETFMHDVGEDRIFRMLEYKKIFTPYEQENKFIDQSVYTDTCYQDVTIEEWIVLEDDILLGLAYLYDYEDFENDNPTIHYHKLSDIELTYDPKVDEEYRDIDDESEDDE